MNSSPIYPWVRKSLILYDNLFKPVPRFAGPRCPPTEVPLNNCPATSQNPLTLCDAMWCSINGMRTEKVTKVKLLQKLSRKFEITGCLAPLHRFPNERIENRNGPLGSLPDIKQHFDAVTLPGRLCLSAVSGISAMEFSKKSI